MGGSWSFREYLVEKKNHLAEFLKCQHLGRTANTKFRMESND